MEKDINKKEIKNITNELIIAVTNGKSELQREIISKYGNYILKSLGKNIATIKDKNGYTLAHALAQYGNEKVQNKILDMFGKGTATIKDNQGWTLAHALAQYGKGKVQERLIKLFRKDIETIKDKEGNILARALAEYGDFKAQKLVIKIMGKDIGKENKREDGVRYNLPTVAHLLVTYGNNEIRKMVIDTLGIDIRTIKDVIGRSLVQLLEVKGNDEVKKKVKKIIKEYKENQAKNLKRD